MAKEQNLSLNSAKISGSCGRLMCCLRFEYDTYLAEKALTPKVDCRVVTPSGAGVVIAANPLAGIVKVRLDGQGEDSDAVVFVREDVVEENKYDGQVLTKTDIPDKKHKNDELPEIKTTSYEKSEAAPVAEAPKADPEAKKPEAEDIREEDDKQKKQFKHKHKKHHRNGNHHQSGNGEGSEKNVVNGDNAQPQAHQKQEHRDHNPNHQNNNPKPKNENPQSQKQDGGDQKNAEGNPNHHKKNKKWKPYYKHSNKGKNREGGENKPS
jgi:hypothetical protein